MWWGLNQSHINAGIAQFQMMQCCFGWKNGSSCPCFAFYCPPCPPPLQREMSILLDRFRRTKRIQVYTSNHAHPNHPRSLVTLVTQNQPWSCSQLLMFHHHGRAGYGLTSGCVVDLILPWSNGASVAQKICGNKMSRSDLNMWEW